MNMMNKFQKDKKLIKVEKSQFQYCGRWVDKENFRAFVYNERNEPKLANSYEEFQRLIASGIWFESKSISSRTRKEKNGTLCSAS
jgi:hypothetical protein